MKYARIVILLLLVQPLQAAAPHYAGRKLVEVIAELQQRGVTVIYSSELVTPAMIVRTEPQSEGTRALLDEILAPYALVTVETSTGVLSIVRAAAKSDHSSPALPELRASDNIVVTASAYSVLSSDPQRHDLYTHEQLNETAHLGDDLFRALGQLPGAASTDFSAAFRVRGGNPDELLIMLDGMELPSPFHIKYFHNAISMIDSDAIGNLDYLSGGYPVGYGGAISGVLDLASTSPQARRHTYAGASFTHARLVSDGTLDSDRGSWLVSLRRGYFDLLLDLFYPGVEARPRYGDAIGRLTYRLGERSVLSAEVLAGQDRFRYSRQSENVEASYSNVSIWATLQNAWTSRLSSSTLASFSHGSERKEGSYSTLSQAGEVADRRQLDILGLRQDWNIDRATPRTTLKAGFDLKRFSTGYQYTSHALTRDPFLSFAGNSLERSRNIDVSPGGTMMALYVSERFDVSRAVTVEAGARYERETWLPEDAATSPRLNVVYRAGASTAIRAAWGDYRQAQRLDRLDVQDGQTTPARAQRSTQMEIAVERQLSSGMDLRATAYERDVRHVRPRYENLFNADEFFPEATYDRIEVAPDSSRQRGVELLLRDNSSPRLRWWTSYTRSSAIDRFGSTETPRSWDQPNAFAFDVNYHPGSIWNFNVAGILHTGWPTTEVTATTSVNPNGGLFLTPHIESRNNGRLPMYRRFDARISRAAPLRHGVFRSWIEVTNVFNRVNACCIGGFDFNIDPSTHAVNVSSRQNGLGWLPSFGLAWEF